MCLLKLRPGGSNIGVATRLAGAGFVYPVEAVKDAGQVAGGDANACVADLVADGFVIGCAAQRDGPLFGGLFDGIFSEVAQNLLEQVRRSFYFGRSVRQIECDGL